MLGSDFGTMINNKTTTSILNIYIITSKENSTESRHTNHVEPTDRSRFVSIQQMKNNRQHTQPQINYIITKCLHEQNKFGRGNNLKLHTQST